MKEKEERLRNVQAQNFLLQEKIATLEKHIEGGDNGQVTKGDKQFTNRGVQVKFAKLKDADAQTEQAMYNQVAFST